MIMGITVRGMNIQIAITILLIALMLFGGFMLAYNNHQQDLLAGSVNNSGLVILWEFGAFLIIYVLVICMWGIVSLFQKSKPPTSRQVRNGLKRQRGAVDMPTIIAVGVVAIAIAASAGVHDWDRRELKKYKAYREQLNEYLAAKEEIATSTTLSADDAPIYPSRYWGDGKPFRTTKKAYGWLHAKPIGVELYIYDGEWAYLVILVESKEGVVYEYALEKRINKIHRHIRNFTRAKVYVQAEIDDGDDDKIGIWIRDREISRIDIAPGILILFGDN